MISITTTTKTTKMKFYEVLRKNVLQFCLLHFKVGGFATQADFTQTDNQINRQTKLYQIIVRITST